MLSLFDLVLKVIKIRLHFFSTSCSQHLKLCARSFPQSRGRSTSEGTTVRSCLKPNRMLTSRDTLEQTLGRKCCFASLGVSRQLLYCLFSVYRFVGTAAMTHQGASYGVIDPGKRRSRSFILEPYSIRSLPPVDFRVKGAAGLRVVDASVLPFVPSGHTQVSIAVNDWIFQRSISIMVVFIGTYIPHCGISKRHNQKAEYWLNLVHSMPPMCSPR
jgi:hypothetical protein